MQTAVTDDSKELIASAAPPFCLVHGNLHALTAAGRLHDGRRGIAAVSKWYFDGIDAENCQLDQES
jgi:hypothetical protein